MFCIVSVVGSVVYSIYFPKPYETMRSKWTAAHLPDHLPSRGIASSAWGPKAEGFPPDQEPDFRIHLEYHDASVFSHEVARLRGLPSTTITYGTLGSSIWDPIESSVEFGLRIAFSAPADSSELLIFHPISPPTDTYWGRVDFCLIDAQARTISYAVVTH